MKHITTIGIDLAKEVFAVCAMDTTGAVAYHKTLKREAFINWGLQLPAGSRVVMEACGSSHHWSRWFAAHGHTAQLAQCDQQIALHLKTQPDAKRLTEMIGIGSLTASAISSTVVDAKHYKNGRQFAAWLGLVPRQMSSGGKTKLGRTSRRGVALVACMRKLLVILNAMVKNNTPWRMVEAG